MNEELQEYIYHEIRKNIPPPNPIITKIMVNEQVDVKGQLEQDKEDHDDQIMEGDITLNNAYYQKNLVFIKWRNIQNVRNNVKFFSSIFFQRFQKPSLVYEGQISESVISFNSNYQSANLFAAYKINDSEYDLIMQNDTNSSGYTQWFNFMALNQQFKGTIKFNIVNFYKAYSLFREGMKPLCKSLKDKNWKRSAYNLQYYRGEITVQGNNNRHYKILSFKYDFQYDNDSVQFCFNLPYTYEMMANFIKDVSSPKGYMSQFRVKYIGLSPMKNIINMLQISSEDKDEKYNKKAIIIMGRQHSGEVPSSYIIQYMIEELLSYTQENQFLLSKYNFYIFPMINVDGVMLGNYRCNLYGYDLNRCWHMEQPRRLPELFCVKNEIKKIMKRFPVELILDIHGHSTKMNSFFYGNTFGKNNLIYPYVVSKIEPFVDFSSCNFTDDIHEKSKTARVILGNLIKDTGSVYTYEVSLYGYIKNNKKFPFTIDNYQEIAKSLIQGMYKSEIQYSKQQKLMKESVFLKEIKKELKKIESKVTNKKNDGSDDEAKIITQVQEQAKKINNISSFTSVTVNKLKDQALQAIEYQVSTQTFFVFIEEEYKLSKPIQLNAITKYKPQKPVNEKMKDTFYKFDSVQLSRKLELMNKLRIYGETFLQPENQLRLSNNNMPLFNASTQTDLYFKSSKSQVKTSTKKFSEEGRSVVRHLPLNLNLLGTYGAFTGKTLRQPISKNRKLSKSNSAKVQASELSFSDLIKYNKIN